MFSLVVAANNILPWNKRFRQLLCSGWKCEYQSIAVGHYIYWHSPHQKDSHSSWYLATITADKFRKLAPKDMISFN